MLMVHDDVDHTMPFFFATSHPKMTFIIKVIDLVPLEDALEKWIGSVPMSITIVLLHADVPRHAMTL